MTERSWRSRFVDMISSTIIAAALAVSSPAVAQPTEFHDELIHSDLPLWASDAEGVFPYSFMTEETFGCGTRLQYGIWRFDRVFHEDSTWFRFANYGVFHCYMLVSDAFEREELIGSQPDPSFLVRLGSSRAVRGTVELWALQRRSRPGSDYILLARRPGPGLISEFDVLQRECPSGRTRSGPPMSILITRYCAINSRRALTALARRMAALPPLGRLTFVEDEAENQAEE